MKLSAELFQQIIARTDPRSTRSMERRHAARTAISAEVVALALHKGVRGEPMQVNVRDISRTGIGITTGTPMQQGDKLLVRLPRNQAKPLWIQCEVVRWQVVGVNAFLVGAKFRAFIDLDQLPPPAPSAAPPVAPRPADSAAAEVNRIREAVFSLSCSAPSPADASGGPPR